MSECNLEINGKALRAERGDTILDAAFAGRVALPHDCATGTCGTCRVSVLEGAVDDQGTRQGTTVLACRSRVVGDCRIAFEPVPEVQKLNGEVAAIAALSPGVTEVRVRLPKRLVWLPGQYVKVTFAGHPARDLSPTFPLDPDAAEEAVLVFQIARRDGGAVSPAIGRTIRAGHKVTIQGPYGHAFLRRGEGPLLLASTGTGFAPVWAIAVAARLGQPWRRIEIVAGARRGEDLYARGIADWCRRMGVGLTLTAGDGDGTEIRRERPQSVLAERAIGESHTVHAAGADGMVAAVEALARARAAEFHADAFTAAPPARPTLGDRFARLLGQFRQGGAAGGSAEKRGRIPLNRAAL